MQQSLNNAAVGLNQAASDIVTSSRKHPQEVAQSTNRFSNAYEEFIDSGLHFAGATKDTDAQMQIVSGLRSVSMVSTKLLLSTKSMLADPNAPNSKHLLQQAARYE